MERPELVADDGLDVRVRAGGVGLELDEEERPVGQELHVAMPIASSAELQQRMSPGTSRRAASSKVQPGPLEAAPDDRQEQLLLRPEQLEHVRLRHAGPAGDRVGRGADQAAGRELLDGRRDDRVAPLVGGHAGERAARWQSAGRCGHAD